MDPATLAALAAASSNASGGILNSVSQQWTNRQNRNFSREMYNRTYADNLSFWHQQNKYNSPSSQMQRFKDAGLNPNLVYGQGTPGNASQIPTPDVQSAPARSPEWGGALQGLGTGIVSSLNQIADLEIKQAQTDNLKAQAGVIRQEEQLKAAQVRSYGLNYETGTFDLGLKKDMRGYNLDAARENIRKTRTDIDISLDRNFREAIQTASNVTEAAERITSMQLQRLSMEADRAKTIQETSKIMAEKAHIRQQIQNLKIDGSLKKLELELKRENIYPHDPMWQRSLNMMLPRMIGITPDSTKSDSIFSKSALPFPFLLSRFKK